MRFRATVTALGRTLKASLDMLVGIDRKLYDANERHAVLRRERDAGFQRLGQQITGLRRSITGQYTAPELAGVGLQDPRARDPHSLLRQGELVADKLGREDLEPSAAARRRCGWSHS